MITLFGFGAGFGLPEISPYVTKTEVQLKMAGLAYRKERAQHRRLDLLRCQHQRRQVESLLEDVAHAGFAADGDTLTDEGCDVAIDRALGGLQLRRDGIGGQRFAGAPEHLDDLEKPVGPSHRSSLLSQGVRPMLTACWQQGFATSGQHLK